MTKKNLIPHKEAFQKIQAFIAEKMPSNKNSVVRAETKVKRVFGSSSWDDSAIRATEIRVELTSKWKLVVWTSKKIDTDGMIDYDALFKAVEEKILPEYLKREQKAETINSGREKTRDLILGPLGLNKDDLCISMPELSSNFSIASRLKWQLNANVGGWVEIHFSCDNEEDKATLAKIVSDEIVANNLDTIRMDKSGSTKSIRVHMATNSIPFGRNLDEWRRLLRNSSL